MTSEPVRINIYDMCSINSYTSRLGIGVFHCGVEVYKTEFGYGGHPFDFSGIFEIEPRDEESLGKDTFKFRETILIGHTHFNENQVREIIKELGTRFRGDYYHVLHNNCNHFSDEFCKKICFTGIPSWINRLAYTITCLPFLEKCLPKEFLTVVAVQQTVKEHFELNQKDLSESLHVNSLILTNSKTKIEKNFRKKLKKDIDRVLP